MTKVCISFAAASGLAGFPDFPPPPLSNCKPSFPKRRLLWSPRLNNAGQNFPILMYYTLSDLAQKTFILPSSSNGSNCPLLGQRTCCFRR